MAFLQGLDPPRVESSVIIDSILNYYSEVSDTDQRINNKSSPKMIDPVQIDEIGEFPLPPLKPISQPIDWFEMNASRTTAIPSHQIRNEMADSYILPRIPDVAIRRSISPSSDINYLDYGETLQSSRTPFNNTNHPPPPPIASSRSNRFAHQQPRNTHRAAGLDFIERYPAIDRKKKRQSEGSRKDGARPGQNNSMDYQRRPLPPAQKGTFAAPFPPNLRSTTQGRPLPTIGSSTPSSASTTLQSRVARGYLAVNQIKDSGRMISNQSPSPPSDYDRSNIQETFQDPSKHDQRIEHGQFDIKRATARTLFVDVNQNPSSNRSQHIPERTSSGIQRNQTPPTKILPGSIHITSSQDISDDLISSIVPQQSGQLPTMASDVCRPTECPESPVLPSADLMHRPRTTVETTPKVSKSRNKAGIPSTVRTSLIEQGTAAQARRASRARSGFSDGSVRLDRPISPSNFYPFSNHKVDNEQQYADVHVSSPKPERLLHSRVSGEESRRELSFEKHIEDARQLGEFREHSKRLSFTSVENPARGPPSERSARFPAISRSNSTVTTHKGKLSWPLPPHPADHILGRHRSYTQSDQLSPRKRNASDNSTSPRKSVTEQNVPPLPNSKTHWLPTADAFRSGSSLGIQHVIDEIAAAQMQDAARTASRTDTNRFSDPKSAAIYEQKVLPRLPDNLDTSAFAEFPLSKEVPLPEFTTARTPIYERPRRSTGLSELHDMSDESAEALVPDFSTFHSVPFLSEHSPIIIDDREPTSSTNYRRLTEQSIPDAYVMYLENGDAGNRQKYRWSVNSFKTRRRLTLDEKRGEAEQVAASSQKPSRGCNPGWKWFWQRFACGGTSERHPISVSDS